MTTKLIYFKVGDRNEQAEITTDIPTDDIKGTLNFMKYIYDFWLVVFTSDS